MNKLSENPTVHPTAQLENATLGRWTEVGSYVRLFHSSLGDYSYIGEHAQADHTTVGKFCSIAAHVRMGPGNHPLERPTTHHLTYRSSAYDLGEDDQEFFAWRAAHPVHIGNDVWIGHGVTILAGVTIGNGAAVGAGAVVSKDIPPYAVAIGIPARAVRYRFLPAECAALERTAYWDWSHPELQERLPDLRGNIQVFLEKYGQ
jgi:phosphonate metabolism protein (transferase hexapeptide repeat family)